MNRELEDKVRARTEELRSSQGQLIQSEKMASLGQLVAGVAHELNNPLTFIVGNVAPLREQLHAIRALAERRNDATTLVICDDMAQILAVIASGAERTATIVKDLRTFSRVEEGHTAVADLRDGLRVTINLLRPRWKDRVAIHAQVDDMPRVECDAGQINQVFMNVLSNACDAVADGGNIWIRATTDGDTVAVAVRDDGVGIPPQVLPRIFDPFFTTKEIGKGTGLGLAIAHGIVARHGGRITVDSEVGRGTEVVVRLPIRERQRSVA
jgi:signal transduction histidine kinase